MKYFKNTLHRLGITILLTFILGNSQAQIKLNGSYVATRVSFLSDDELPEDNIIKYTYVKYTFKDPDQINISSAYYKLGSPLFFEIKGNLLLVKNEQGGILNTMKILESTEDKLILVNGVTNASLENPWAIKYTLYKEDYIQKNSPLSPDDIFSVNGTDTIYKSGQKIYAQFKGPSFQAYVSDYMQRKKISVKNGEFDATFIVNEHGYPDSLHIIRGITPQFDAQYAKAINLTRKLWRPAYHNGKVVKVLMDHSLRYTTSEKAMPAYFDTQQANVAYKNKDYERALFLFDKALELRSEDIDNLYRRGICKQKLGNSEGACADWLKIQRLGYKTANELLLKFCK